METRTHSKKTGRYRKAKRVGYIRTILKMEDKYKKCPYCAEDIKFDAIKCKHCGEFLEIVDQTENNKKGVWRCKKCKEEVEDSFDICWSCGANKEVVIDKESKFEFKELKKEVGNTNSTGGGNITLFAIIFAALGFGLGYLMYGKILGTNSN